MQRIGIVLSGGGALSVAHLGLLKVLEEHEIKPTHFSANSAGAIIAALYYHNYSVEEILAIIQTENWLSVPFDKLKKQKILSVDDMFESFQKYFPEQFDSEFLNILAADINSGALINYNKGDLRTILKASAALSTFFKPVKYLGRDLVDSALLNNFNVEPLKSNCDIIYGSYAIPMTTYNPKYEENVQQLSNRLFTINGYQRAKEKFKYCNYIFDHQYLTDFKVLDKDKMDIIYEKSYAYCKEVFTSVAI